MFIVLTFREGSVFFFIRYHMLDLYCLRNGLNPMLVAFVSGLLLKGKHIYLAAFVSEFITVYLNNFFFFTYPHVQ